ncbi:RTA1 like protein-domain-containing protein [Lipomyces kononenkoae]|uniref:RTA1 like protein-domain-containing protein n=1 Tax=Lipomyces kononenkoae TaxID=34357 RepID=A0ACC3T479_LIPKO
MSATTGTISYSTSITASVSATATCTNPKPGKNGYLPPDACDVILLYVPSFGAAILFSVLFGLTLICHVVQGIIYKKKYTWVVMMGALWELLAFILRALLTRNQSSTGYDTGHVIMFLLAPIWINAFLYMTLGRLIHFFIPDQRLGGISAKRYGTVFVLLDIIAFIIQLAGASITTETNVSSATIMQGVHIYMGGIGLQEFFILIFTGLIILLHRRMLSMEHSGELDPEKVNRGSIPWRWMIYAIYTTLGMITIRIIFRLCQYARGTDASNPVVTHEFYEYVFDALPMFVALVILNYFHPGRILQGPDSEFSKVSRQEKKRIKNEKKEAKKAERARKKDSNVFESLSAQEEGNASEEI